MKKNLPEKLEGYSQLLDDVKSILKRGLYKAYQAVDNLKVQTYWQIGERIVREELKYKERADYGRYILKQLAGDLRVNRSDLFSMVQFYRIYPIVHALSGQFPIFNDY